MRVIDGDEPLYDEVWDRIDAEFGFDPAFVHHGRGPFDFRIDHKIYESPKVWTQEQERIVNGIFAQVSEEDIYALEWNSDGFVFNPREEIPLYYSYHDSERGCNVYFPSYWPNGDYYFFLSKNFSYGMLGVPFADGKSRGYVGELHVFGEELIELFEREKDRLGLVDTTNDPVSLRTSLQHSKKKRCGGDRHGSR